MFICTRLPSQPLVASHNVVPLVASHNVVAIKKRAGVVTLRANGPRAFKDFVH